MTAVIESAPPRFHHVPLHIGSAGQDAVDLAELAGLTLDDWQAELLRGSLTFTPANQWAAMEVALVVPRQNGKNRVLAARQLFGLYLNRRDKLQTHTAHRADTCFEQHKYLCELIEGTPDLLARVKDNGRGIGDRPSGIKDSNGKESIELVDGSRIIFRTRVKGSGRGFTGDVVYFDEAFYLYDTGSLIPSLGARPDPQIWYTSSAPLPGSESDVLRGLVRRGRALHGSTDNPDALAYDEWSAPMDADRNDPDTARMSNPSYGAERPDGSGINERFTDMMRRTLPPAEFDREILGMFPDEDDEPQWLVIPEAAWSSTVVPAEVGWLVAPRLAVEVAPDFSEASIVAAGQRTDGEGEGIELVDHRPGIGWLVARVVELQEAHGKSDVVIDKGSPADVVATAALVAAGVDVLHADTEHVVIAAADLILGVGAKSVWHPDADDQGPLTKSVASAVLRNYSDVTLFDRRLGAVVCPVIAASLALWGSRRPVVSTESVYESRGLVEL